MIIPALDLIDGNVVRLYQGDYKQKLNYGNNPLQYIKNYENQGAQILHLVDLTGAKFPRQRQSTLFSDLLSNIKIPTQVGGGIRSSSDIALLLSAGAIRVVVGSTAVTCQDEVKSWFHDFGSNSIVLALDVRIDSKNCKKIAIKGWQETVNVTLEEVINSYQKVGLQHVLCTDISRDGTMYGANITLYEEISNQFPNIRFQSSGGIGSLNDISALRSSGVQDVIIGRAFLEGKFTIKEAITCWQKE